MISFRIANSYGAFYSVLIFPGDSDGKESAQSAEDLGSIYGLGRSPRKGNGNPLQHSCLENPMDGGAWQATVRGVAKSRTRLSDFTFFFFLSSVKWDDNHNLYPRDALRKTSECLLSHLEVSTSRKVYD